MATTLRSLFPRTTHSTGVTRTVTRTASWAQGMGLPDMRLSASCSWLKQSNGRGVQFPVCLLCSAVFVEFHGFMSHDLEFSSFRLRRMMGTLTDFADDLGACCKSSCCNHLYRWH